MMTLEEEGAYRRALDFCWLNGSLPLDPEMLARLIGKNCSAATANTVQQMFILNPKNSQEYIHERLEVERKKQKDFKEKKSKAGTASGISRRKKNKLSPEQVLNSVPVLLGTNGEQKRTLQSAYSSLHSASSEEEELPQFEAKSLNQNGGRRQAARAREEAPPPEVASLPAAAKSFFSFPERLKYAESQPKATNPERLANWLGNGEQDDEMREFFKPRQAAQSGEALETRYRVKIAYLISVNTGCDYSDQALFDDLKFHFEKLNKWDELLARKLLHPKGD